VTGLQGEHNHKQKHRNIWAYIIFLFGAFVLKHYVSNLWSELEILYNSKRVVCIYRVNQMYNWNVRDIEILLKKCFIKGITFREVERWRAAEFGQFFVYTHTLLFWTKLTACTFVYTIRLFCSLAIIWLGPFFWHTFCIFCQMFSELYLVNIIVYKVHGLVLFIKWCSKLWCLRYEVWAIDITKIMLSIHPADNCILTK